MQLYKLADNYREAVIGMTELLDSGEITEQDMADTLEGISGEVQDKAINTALHIKNLRSDLSQVEEARKAFDDRAKAIKKSLDFFEHYLDDNLKKAGIDNLSHQMVTVKYKKLPPIVDVSGDVPEQYQRIIPEKREPDKKAIGDALKSGEHLDFASLITGRTKLDIK